MSNQSTKRDSNHKEISTGLVQAGCSVEDLASVGGGCPDLLVAHPKCFANVLMEIKVDKGKLSPGQVEWHRHWHGPVFVVRTLEDGLRAMGLLESATKEG